MKSHRFYFYDIHDDEQVLRVIHRHWFDIVWQYVPLFIMTLLVVVSFFFLPFIGSVLDAAAVQLILFVQSFFLLVLWLYGFMIWVDYYLDIWVVTSERMINVEQKGLFAREVSELRFTQIQDITTDVKGFIPTLLNYGDVLVQTAAEETQFEFHKIKDPYRVKAQLMDLHKKSYKRMLAISKKPQGV